MKLQRLPSLLFVCLTSYSLSGCLGFVLHGDAYRALAFPTPLSDEWSKDGVSHEQRRTDWVACGGYENGGVSYPKEKVMALAEKEDLTEKEAWSRVYNDIQRCMLRNGYRFTGKCHDNEISRSKPACGAP